MRPEIVNYSNEEPNSDSSTNSWPKTKKPWMTIQKNEPHSSRAIMNGAIQGLYRDIVYRAKQLLKQQEQTVFERDYRYDENTILGLHSFMCTSFYIYLECELCYQYRVEYAFNNCLFEAELREQLGQYPLDRRATEVKLEPTFTAYFQNTLNFQDKKYVYILKA